MYIKHFRHLVQECLSVQWCQQLHQYLDLLNCIIIFVVIIIPVSVPHPFLRLASRFSGEQQHLLCLAELPPDPPRQQWRVFLPGLPLLPPAALVQLDGPGAARDAGVAVS